MTEQDQSPLNVDQDGSKDVAVDSVHQLVAEIFELGIRHGEALRKAAEKIELKSAEDYRLIVFFFFARSLRTYVAVRQLWFQGFGAECWILGRSMIEMLLQTALLRRDPLSTRRNSSNTLR